MLRGIVRRIIDRVASIKEALPALAATRRADENPPALGVVQTSFGKVSFPKASRPLFVHEMARIMWLPMLLMGLIALYGGLVLALVASGTSDAGLTRSLKAWVQGLQFLGEDSCSRRSRSSWARSWPPFAAAGARSRSRSAPPSKMATPNVRNDFDVRMTVHALQPNLAQRIGRRLWLPMLAMALMAFPAALALAFIRANLVAESGSAVTVAALGQFEVAAMFLGFASVFASISFAIARILGVLRWGGGSVQESTGRSVQTLKMPLTAGSSSA